MLLSGILTAIPLTFDGVPFGWEATGFNPLLQIYIGDPYQTPAKP